MRYRDSLINYEKDDYIVSAQAKSGLIRGFAMRSTALVEDARHLHELCPTTTVALGQLLTANALMASDLKTDEASLTLNIRGDGPLHTLLTVGSKNGQVRGFADPPAVETIYTEDGRIDIARAIGNGTLNVSRDDGLNRRPYVSSVELVKSTVAHEIASYLYFSAQIPSVVLLGVKLSPDGVKHAGGMMLQLMPGWDDRLADWLEQRAHGFPEITYWFEEGMNPHQLLDLMLGAPDIKYADPARAAFRCTCREERMLDNLFALPADDIRELIQDPAGVHVNCHFCNKHYHFSQDTLSAVLAARTAGQGD